MRKPSGVLAGVPVLLGLAAALLAVASTGGCVAFNEPCTSFVDDPDAVVGYLADEVPLTEDVVRVDDAAIGQLVAESSLHAFDDVPGAEAGEVGVENAGSIREEGLCEPREELPGGPVRKKVLREVLPFDNTLRLVRISEQGLKDVLEHSYARLATIDPQYGGFLQLAGLEVAVDCTQAAEQLSDAGRIPGQRVVDLVLRPREDVTCDEGQSCAVPGHPDCVRELASLGGSTSARLLCGRRLDLASLGTAPTIRLVTNSFLAGGNDNFLDFKDPAVTETLAESSSLSFQLLAGYFQRTYTEDSPFPAQARDRIVLINCR